MTVNTVRASSVNAPTARKAVVQAADELPPDKSRIQPTISGPTKPPEYPSIEWTARVAPRRSGSALPAAPAVSDAESSEMKPP